MTVLAAALLAAATVVTTQQGPVRGETTSDGRSLFRGIPFAAPPIGRLRWRPPAAPARRRGVLDATRSASACPQVDYGWNHDAAVEQSEDCLYLEIATPDPAPPAPMPVMVWIHGGGNRAGGGAGTIQSAIARRGVVLVSIQYRMGALGFLSHAALSAEADGRSGNYGIMDQQAALSWVRANIARFGGDPANVTLFGESAGAQDIGLHLLSPGSRGLFAKAIEESGTPGFGLPPRSLAQNEAIGGAIVTRAGARPGAGAAALRRLSAKALVDAAEATDVPDLADDSYIWLQAVVDGRVLRETPAATLAAGRGNPAPLIVGSNARELPLHGGMAGVDAAIATGFGDRAAAARNAYGLAPGTVPVVDPRLGPVDGQVANDLTFRCPAVTLARARVRAGEPVWHYHFDYSAPDGKPVTHGSEIRHVLSGGDAAEPGAPPMQAYWLNFARTGDPNGGGLPAWPAYTEPVRAYLAFDNGGPTPGANLRHPICGWRDAP